MGKAEDKAKDDIFKFKRPGVAVDVILFTIKKGELQAGLIQRKEAPYSGKYALPGRFVRYEEPIEETAGQALMIKGGIDPQSVFLEQLYTFGQNLERDTRIRTISIVYFGLISAEKIDFQRGNKFQWFSVYNLPSLAFDHQDIINYAVQRLREKIWRSSFAFQLLPAEFTLTELQKAYEVIFGEQLDKRNFRKRIAELDLLKDLLKKKMEGVHRPAALYAFKKKG